MTDEDKHDSVFAEFSFLFALCRRFGVDDRNWVLRINLPHLRGPIDADAYDQFYDQIVALADAFGDSPLPRHAHVYSSAYRTCRRDCSLDLPRGSLRL